jgi:deoxyribodipyrimidine photolyase-related protein
MRTVWILGDQLQDDHPALARADRKKDRVLFIESRQRSRQVTYHQLKLVLIFSAMRHRAAALRKEGWQVDYVELADDFTYALRAQLQRQPSSAILMQEPSQYAFRQMLPKLARELGLPIQTVPTNQFLLTEAEFTEWAADRRHLLMENHYRRMRLKLGLLLERDGKPTGGAWNYDAANRQTAAAFAKSRLRLPPAPHAEPDALTQKVIALVKREFPDHPGDAAHFWLPDTRDTARAWLKDFIAHRLEHFGPWEDMMLAGEPTLYHSVLTPMLNIGLLTPRECVEAAVAAFRAGHAPLESVEGFVRQIIGWREFINGIYWHRMPGYEELNALGAQRPLPRWIYSGDTEMNCLRRVIGQAVRLGYNHHIQRLMVLGNFFLLGGFLPSAVLRWYLEMYVDAHDWVMAANVIGMVLHADGGYMATKPYAAGAGYIHKMSNYCAGCRYRPDVRTGPDACPFNYLYWNFYATHEKRFAQNPRVGMMLKTWNAKPASEKALIRRHATDFLDAQATG